MHLDDEPAERLQGAGVARTPGRRWSVVGVLVAALVIGALAVDRTVRDREVDALLEDVDAVSEAVVLGDRRVSGLQQYLRPSPSLDSTGSGLAGQLAGLEEQARGQARDDVLGHLAGLQEGEVLAWHGDVTAARVLVGAYVEAEAARLGATGADRVVARDAAADALAAAAASLRTLVPDPDRSARLEDSLGRLPGAGDAP